MIRIRPRLPSSADLPRLPFAALLLALLAGATWLAAAGLDGLRQQAEAHLITRLRNPASSPLQFGQRLPPAALLVAERTGATTDRWTVLVRADSVPEGPARTAVCSLTENGGDIPPITWYALTDAPPPPCLSAAGVTPLPASSEREILAAELAGARWIALDAEGRVLYSARTLPTPQDLRELAMLLDASRR